MIRFAHWLRPYRTAHTLPRTSWHLLRVRHATTSVAAAAAAEELPVTSQGKRSYDLRAFYLANSIDIFALAQHKQDTDPLIPQLLQKNHLIFTLNAEDGQSPTQYLAFYEYGAVVLFLNNKGGAAEGIDTDFVRQSLDETMPFCRGKFNVPASEDYTVVVNPSATEWCELGDNALRVQTLDIHNLRIIAETIGQSVALQHYESQAINMLKQFRSSNSTVIREGSKSLRKKDLFKMIAENNKILIDVMANLGLLDRAGPISWRYDKYYKVWEVMRDEFELQRRFKSVDDKINMVQENAKFFLEVLSHDKSERLEWIIVVLIAGELSLGLYDHFQFHPLPLIG